MRVVHHAKYLEYFELGRSSLIRSLGMSYAELEARGIFLPVIEAYAHYHRPILYDELIVVHSSIAELPKASLRIEYKILREGESHVLAKGYTIHGFLDAARNKPTRAPVYFLDMLEQGMKNGSDHLQEGK